MKSIIVYAPAKVNIVLRVLGRRADGYHDLFMIMEKLSLADELLLEEIPFGTEIAIEGESDVGMASEKNLAYRAAELFRKEIGEKQGIRIHLKKRIPIAAGLGGGSSDAAAVLRGLNRLWQKGLNSNELGILGAKLGGDVPFFCFDGPAIVEGIGDRVTTIPNLPNLFLLLINPGVAVSTSWVYQEYDRLLGGLKSHVSGHRSLELTPNVKDASNCGLLKGFCNVISSLENDLEDVTLAVYPEVREIRDFLISQGADGALMSGSGPTVFGMFENAKARDKVLGHISNKNWKVFATDNIRDPESGTRDQ